MTKEEAVILFEDGERKIEKKIRHGVLLQEEAESRRGDQTRGRGAPGLNG